MQIRFASHKTCPRHLPAASEPADGGIARAQDTFQRSPKTDEISRPNPAWRTSPAQSTQEAIARIQERLDTEWKFFGCQSYDAEGHKTKEGISEEDPRVFKRVGYFWETGTGLKLDGRDRDWPWSAAFISTVHEDSEVGTQFRRSPAHARYIRDAIFSKKDGIEQAAYWGHRTTERAPQVGDMVCYSRQKGVSYDRQPLRYKSHADIVTAVRPGEVDVVGGNVGHSVSKRTLKTDENGFIADTSKNWFAVLEPKNLSRFSILPPPENGDETAYPKRPEDWAPELVG